MLNKRIISILVVLVIIFVIIIIWFVKNDEREDNQIINNIIDNTEELVNADFKLNTRSKIDLEKLKSYNLPIIIDFGADGCGPCKVMEPDLEELNEELQGKAIIKFIDVWKYPTLASEYPIQLIPTQILFNSDGTPYAPANASELGLEDGAINIQYYYAGEFQATTAATQYCTSWYQRGTEVIFGCGGGVYQSVISASQAAGNKPWIGVDVNQHADTSLGQSQDTCITSAMKNLQESTEVLLTTYVQNDLSWGDSLAGEVVTVGAQSESCVLPTPETTGDPDCWGFENFTIEEYDSILAMLKDGSVKVNSNSNNEQLSAHNFGCSAKVSINYIA